MPYLTPTRAPEALDLLRRHAPKVIAGCTDYFPSRPEGPTAAYLMDVTGIEGMRGVARTADGWRIGAATTWTDLLRADLPPAFDALRLAAREVGSVQIQNRGTVAGNLCTASPAADGVPPLMVLDAAVEIASAEARRIVPLDAFLLGARRVDLRPGEMVTAVHVPPVSPDMRSRFIKLGARTHLVISIVMVAVAVRIRAGRIAEARIAVGSCAPVARRLPALEARAAGLGPGDLAAWDVAAEAETLLAPLAPIADIRGTAEYRLEAVAELCRRALIDAAGEG
jgi:CO/xanthine dehydrogenase FAD-binding subunit